MDKKIQLTVRPCTESEPELLKLLEKKSGSLVRKDGCLYFSKNGLVFSCRDSYEANEFLELISG